VFFQVAEEGVARRIRHGSGTGFTGHERDEVTIKLCLKERRIVVVVVVVIITNN